MVGANKVYLTKSIPQGDAVKVLQEALLGSELAKNPRSIRVSFESPDDCDRAHRILTGLQNGYVPDRGR
jgi:hypothetical protein